MIQYTHNNCFQQFYQNLRKTIENFEKCLVYSINQKQFESPEMLDDNFKAVFFSEKTNIIANTLSSPFHSESKTII